MMNGWKKFSRSSDKMPENKQYLCAVLIPVDGGGFTIGYRVLRYIKSIGWNCEGLIVTHYMDLPELPNEVI